MKPRKWRISLGQLMLMIGAFAFGLAISPPWALYLALLPPVALGIASFRLRPIAFLASLFLVFFAWDEVALAMPVPVYIYAPIAILISGVFWPADSHSWRSSRTIALIGVNTLILALILMPWSTRKPFLRDLYSIKPGMTVVEANRIMAGYKQGTGWTQPGSSQEFRPAGSIVFRHSDDGFFNADWGVVTIHDGKVVDVSFLPD